ncbi:hypothetical protein HDU84_008337 [Entophlyctis sp. JEL0112]|nr:hypothetical protein HDU84_008337 [Entophlyctis sp. JEL0112]
MVGQSMRSYPPNYDRGYPPHDGGTDGYHFSRRMAAQMNVAHDKGQYLQELNEQVRLKKEREENERILRRAEELKKEREMELYNPWGKSGSGAPLRNVDGSISTNLRIRPDANNSANMPFQHNIMAHPTGVPAYMGQPQPQMDQTHIAQQIGMNFLSGLAQQGIGSPYGMIVPGSVVPPAPFPSSVNNFGYNDLNQAYVPKSFLRGHVPLEQMPDWQRAEIAQKQKAQHEIQDALKKQVDERAAAKAKLLQQQKDDEVREQERIAKEQEMLRQKYARELEEQRRKEAEVQAENERKLAEKVAKEKEAERLREESLREAEKRKTSQSVHNDAATKSNEAVNTSSNFRSNSPPIPTLRKSLPDSSAGISEPTFQQQPVAPARADKEQPKYATKIQMQPREPKYDNSSVLQQLLSIQRELEEEDKKIKRDLDAPLQIPPKVNTDDVHAGPSPKNLLDDIVAAHRKEVDNAPAPTAMFAKSKFYIPSVLEQQKQILEQQDREIKALREEGRRTELLVNLPLKEPEVSEKKLVCENPLGSSSAERDHNITYTYL